MTMSNWLELLGYVIVLIVLSPFLLFALAKMGYLATTLESGNIKFIVESDTLHKIIADVPGVLLEDGKLIRPADHSPVARKKPWFGLYWVGLPPFRSVHTFYIKKERENPAGSGVDDWIISGEKELVDSLRFAFPRPYIMKEVELKDRTAVDLLLLGKFEVVDPYIPVFGYKGNVFELAGSMLKAAVNHIAISFDIEGFLMADKGEGGILKELTDVDNPFNKELIELTGLRLRGISIPQYDPSDKAVRAAMNAQAVATMNAEAGVTTADGKAREIERLAKARGAQVRETITNMMVAGVNPDVAAKSAGKVLEMEAATSPTSKLTTLVTGGGASPVIPVGGDK